MIILDPEAPERRDAHNIGIDFRAATAHLCGRLHLQSGRVCRLAERHPDGCQFEAEPLTGDPTAPRPARTSPPWQTRTHVPVLAFGLTGPATTLNDTHELGSLPVTSMSAGTGRPPGPCYLPLIAVSPGSSHLRQRAEAGSRCNVECVQTVNST
jgi:hypothetical protein